MKNKIYIFLTAISLFAIFRSEAQNIYGFTFTTSSYVPLVSPTITVNNAGFIGYSQSLPFGFNFSYWGNNYTSLFYSTDAYFSFFLAPGAYGFYPFSSNLKGIGNSQVGYEISGSSGNKIAKIEWKNVGFMADSAGKDSVSFQIWLYETSSKVEFHFGPNSVPFTDFSALFGNNSGNQIYFGNLSGSSFYNLQGNSGSPAAVYNPATSIYLNGYPSDGQVYIFAPVNPGIIPTSSFSIPTSGCVGAVLTLTNNSTGTPTPSYIWSITPAAGATFSPNSSTISPQLSFGTGGSYTITCVATNSIGTDSSQRNISISYCDVDLEEDDLVNVFFILKPNPSDGIFNLTTSFREITKLEICLLDSRGKQVSKPVCVFQNDCISLDLTGQENGVYLICISSGSEHIYRRAVVIR